MGVGWSWARKLVVRSWTAPPSGLTCPSPSSRRGCALLVLLQLEDARVDAAGIDADALELVLAPAYAGLTCPPPSSCC